MWGATCAYRDDRATGGNISIHAPRVGRDAKSGYTLGEVTVFQSTRPVWGATTCILARPNTWRKFQSTRPVWGATELAGYTAKPSFISIHAPRVGRDHRDDVFGILAAVFQSTRPVWGATNEAISQFADIKSFQSTRPVWGATQPYCCSTSSRVFQSTRPVWGATGSITELNGVMVDFNPRAPCGARRSALRGRDIDVRDFNPRAPCGARRLPAVYLWPRVVFQSTRPVWGATQPYCCSTSSRVFQSTRPVWGATLPLRYLRTT